MSMRESSRFIADEDIDNAAPWNFGAVDTASLKLARQVKERDEVAEQARAEIARQDGFADGFKQGRAHAALEAQNTINDFIKNQGEEAAKVFAALFESAQRQLDDAQQQIAQGVLELACELSRQILRQEFSVNPNVLQPVIREALGLLIGDSKGATVRLNPIDLDVLQDPLATEFATLPLTLLPDPAIERGGCLVEAAGTVIDGTLQKRWTRAVTNLGLDLSWDEPSHVG
jgi:flagellar assembly protein FliH